MDAQEVKQKLYELGAVLAGVASVDRFGDAPTGYHPLDVLPECKSVAAFAKPFVAGTLRSPSSAPYTVTRNVLSGEMNRMAVELSLCMERAGYRCAPLDAIGDEEDERTGRNRAPVSFKHAAQAAGLGVIGRHSLLITPRYGSMVWLGLVLTEAELAPDPLCDWNPCAKCVGLCRRACPVHAADGELLDQHACWKHAFGTVRGDWRISCHACRDACPHNFGTDNAGLR